MNNFRDPTIYVCADCKAHGVRLWREYQTFLDHQVLRCRACSMVNQGKTEESQRGTDQIGWLVPAVPTPDGSTFWGYTSVDAEGVAWWETLPVTAWRSQGLDVEP